MLLIIPGFLTDLIGFLLIIPLTRKILIINISSKFKKKQTQTREDFIEGDIEETAYETKNKDENK